MNHKLIIVLTILTITHFLYGMTLNDAIRIGKERSLFLADPKIEIIKMNGKIKEAWSNALPQAEGIIGYQRAWKKSVMFFPNPITGQTEKIELTKNNTAIGEATITQPIYTFGRIGAGLKGAYAAKRANEHLLKNQTYQLELEIMKRFWSVLLTKKIVEVQNQALEIADSALQNIQRLYNNGLMSEYDVLRAEVQKNLQIPKLKEAQNQFHLAQLALKEILGIPMDSTFLVEGNLDEYEIPVDTSQSDDFIRKREDIQALEHLVEMNKNIWTIYKNAKYPSIGSQIKYAWQWSEENWQLKPRNNASSVTGGISISIPILTSGKNTGTAQQYEADYQKMKNHYQQALRAARLQFESAFGNYQTALLNEQAAKKTVLQAETARKISQTKLNQGQATPLEFDNARLDETIAKVTLAQTTFQRLVAAAETRIALGKEPFLE